MSKNNFTSSIIQIEKISTTEQKIIALSLFPHVVDYFNDPDVQQKYNEWLQNRRKNFV